MQVCTGISGRAIVYVRVILYTCTMCLCMRLHSFASVRACQYACVQVCACVPVCMRASECVRIGAGVCAQLSARALMCVCFKFMHVLECLRVMARACQYVCARA